MDGDGLLAEGDCDDEDPTLGGDEVGAADVFLESDDDVAGAGACTA